jgi:hypothetical protein
LPLSEFYAGGVSYIEVMLWADSGEVISVEALGGGFSYPEPTPETSQSTQTCDTQTNSTNSISWTIYIAVACVVIAIPIAVSALVFKKRSK